MKDSTKARLRRLRDRVAEARERLTPPEPDLPDRVNRLASRVRLLEEEVEECRRLNRRIAELTDVVQELLLPMAQRDEAGVEEKLRKYSSLL